MIADSVLGGGSEMKHDIEIGQNRLKNLNDTKSLIGAIKDSLYPDHSSKTSGLGTFNYSGEPLAEFKIG